MNTSSTIDVPGSTCPPGCTSSSREHDHEREQGLSLIHNVGHASFKYDDTTELTFSLERHEEADGRIHDVIWVESDMVDVGSAAAFARAILGLAEADA